MPQPIRPIERRFADAVFAAGLAASDDLASRMDDDGFADIRPTDWAVLRRLQHGALPIGKLAPLLEISQQATSKAVRDLEYRDYVQLVIPPDDNRVREVWLTARGWQVLAAADRWTEHQQVTATTRWGRSDVRTATSMLTRFAAASPRFRTRGRNLRGTEATNDQS